MRKGFTLIELLVVVSIIALLIAILLPVLMRTKEHTRRVQCMSNMRQFQTGTVNYSLEHDGFYPDGKRDDGGYHPGFLSTPVYEYVLTSTGGNKAIFACPSVTENRGESTSGARYVLPSVTPPNGLGWNLSGYIHLGGFDFTGWSTNSEFKTWVSPQTLDSAIPNTKIIVDFSYQSGPTINNPSVGMHGPKGEIRKGVQQYGRLTPEELGIEGGNYATIDGVVAWQDVTEMKPYTVNKNMNAWNWH